MPRDMDLSKKDSVTNTAPASIVDLKAELHKKQQEFAQRKSLAVNTEADQRTKYNKRSKKAAWIISNPGVERRKAADFQNRSPDEEEKLEASRMALEAKSKMYEKMAAKGDNMEDEDGNSLYLVDFERKFIDKVMDERHATLKKERDTSEEAKGNNLKGGEIIDDVMSDDEVPDEEQWVDYTDSLGRSRRCMKKDLPKLRDLDSSISHGGSNSEETTEQLPDLMSSDMHREILRQKWEAEQKDMLDNQETVHYANVRFDEKRTHGVGFYQFSKAEDERQKEIEKLRSLTKETNVQREAKLKLKEKRKAILNARLEKVRMRRIAQGKPVPEAKTDKVEDSADKVEDSADKVEETATEITTSLSNVEDEPKPKKISIREWDVGKSGVFLPTRPEKPKSWADPRNRRDEEFAPPSFYYANDRVDNSKANSQIPSEQLTRVNAASTDDKSFHFTSLAASIPLPSTSGVDSIPLPSTSGVDSIPLPSTSGVDSIPLPSDSGVDSIPLPTTSEVNGKGHTHMSSIDDMLKSLRKQS